MWLVIGLGNPGPQYAGNRHNVGFMVVDEIVRRTGLATIAFRSKFGGEVAEAMVAGQRALLCKPMQFMNVSGQAAQRTAAFWKVPPARTLVVHDELDLPFSRLKLAAGGGAGGHNGVRSLIADLGTPDFPRLRVGIGRPTGSRDAAGYVLADFSKAEGKELPFVLAAAADAVEVVVGEGLTAAMNRFNKRKAGDARGAD